MKTLEYHKDWCVSMILMGTSVGLGFMGQGDGQNSEPGRLAGHCDKEGVTRM